MTKSDPPQPPNPLATASAQTGTNISTAIANAYLNSTNQVTPQGGLTYNQTSMFDYTDPTTGQTFQIPRFTATQSLTPTEQEILDRQRFAKDTLAKAANTQSENIDRLVNQSFDPLTGAGPRGDANLIANVPLAATTFGDAGDISRSYGADNQRDRVEQAMFERLQPQLDRQRTQLEQRLADQGIRYGSPAYSAAMDDFSRSVTDTRLGITAAGGQEQKLQEDVAAQRAGFQNSAQMQQFQQVAARGQFSNQSLAQQIAQQQAVVAARNNARAQYMQEQFALRNQPIQETSALLSGSQVSQPQWVQTPSTPIPTTDIAALINQNFSQQFQNYQAQQTAQNQLLGGILGATGSIGAGLAFRSDRRAKKNIHRIGTVFAAEPQPVEEPAKKKLAVYEYAYKDDPASLRHIGPMAQDMEKVDPSAVGEDKRGVKYINAGRMMGSILRAA
jgi:hypothetical protein